MMQSAGVAAVLFVVVAGTARADKTFESKLGSDAAKLADDVKISMMNGDNAGREDGRGLVPYYKALGAPPKRVALISFYVWDCGNKKESSYNIYGGDYTYHVKNSRTRNLEAEAVDMLANELHDASIGAVKEAFAAVGTQLLTPDEFLDTDAKKEAYENFKLEIGGFGRFLHSVQKRGHDDWQWGAPDGYRVIELTTVGDVKGNHFQLGMTGVGIGKAAISLGHDFAGALGVDAVAILYNVVQAESKSIRMRGAGLYMFGPNPLPDTGKSLYWNGLEYSGVYLRMDVPFITTDKAGKLIDADYDGYVLVGRALATKMAEHIKKKTG